MTKDKTSSVRNINSLGILDAYIIDQLNQNPQSYDLPELRLPDTRLQEEAVPVAIEQETVIIIEL